ncbi:MAG: EAL domain-containing protein [Candidatus Competibacteraceae bacterium]|nr:EAL domain-containing protein [Candidatus Competibacteraceae bacterium]
MDGNSASSELLEFYTRPDYRVSILLAEDDEDHAELAQRAIKTCDPSCELIVVGSLKAARTWLTRQMPDLLIADLHLPDGSGIDLLHADAPLAYPVIIIISQGDERMAVEAMKAGAMDYVVKSIHAFRQLPHIAQRTMREWRHITERQRIEAALRCSEERMRSVTANLPGIVYQFFIRSESEMGVHYIDGRVEEIFGLSREQYHPQTDLFEWFLARIDERDRPRLLSSILEATIEFKPWYFEGRFIKPSGEMIWFKSLSSPRQLETEIVFDGMLLDITGEKRAEKALRESEERFRSIVQHARDVIVILDAQMQINYISPRSQAMLGYEPEALLGQSALKLIHPRDLIQVRAAFTEVLVSDQRGTPTEFRFRHQHGYWTEVEAIATNLFERPEIGGVLVILRDVNERRQAEERIKHLARHDPVTGLPNRTLLAEQAELLIALIARHKGNLSLLFCDLDHFKDLNDSLGHLVGDLLLMEVASRIKKVLRDTDTLARLGGDEFIILLPHVGRDGAARVAEKILTILQEPVVLADHRFAVTSSIGISVYPYNGSSFQELLKNSDTAMYQAKQAGRNMFRFHDPAMHTASLERLTLMSALRKAIQTGQLRTYFQPKISLADGRVVGAEALVRWQHPNEGLLPPGRFIPWAEDNDLIIGIGRWVLEDVCRQLAIWRQTQLQELMGLRVAVNIAARHFCTPNLASYLEALLWRYDLPHDALELELTESAVLEAGLETLTTFQELRQVGFTLAIDDFGTGYSSLAYLKNLPITSLKIDRSFVRDLTIDPDDRAIAAIIVTLGHSLGLEVVAEGIETEEQRVILLEQDCDFAQGYLFSPPLPAAEFVEWVRQRN